MPSVRDVPFAGPRRGTEAVRLFFDELAEADELEAFEVNDEFIAQGDRSSGAVPTGAGSKPRDGSGK